MAYVQIREGALVASAPEERYFRFEDCATHAKVSGLGVSECDFVWATEEGEFWVMELKDYGSDSRAELADNVDTLRTALPKNVMHACLLLSAVWAETEFGKKLRADIEQTFPAFPQQAQPTRAALVIRLEKATDGPLLLALQDAIQGALKILSLESVIVLPAMDENLEDQIGIKISEPAN